MSVIGWVFTQMPWFMVIEKFVTPSDVFEDSLRYFVTKQALVVGDASFWKNKMCLWNTNAPDNGLFQIWSRSQRQILWYQYKYRVTRNAHVKYKSSNFYYFVMNNVLFKYQMSRSKGFVPTKGIFMWNMKTMALPVEMLLAMLSFQKVGQTPRSQVNIVGTHWKLLPQGLVMWNNKALALTVQKLLARLHFSKNGTISKVKVTVSKIKVPTESFREENRRTKCQTGQYASRSSQSSISGA